LYWVVIKAFFLHPSQAICKARKSQKQKFPIEKMQQNKKKFITWKSKE
jgi:hypothetical protein